MDVPATATIADQLLKSIKQNGIPPRPAILERVETESKKPEPDLRQLAVFINGDVGIAASLLKTVNSPFYGLSGKAHTTQQAVNQLGQEATVNAVASIALQRVLPPPPQLERFWDGSLQVARLSGWLAQELSSRTQITADHAYTFGLFRDCGIPIMMNKFSGYRDTLQAANTCPEKAFTEVEELQHGTSHALVGYLLAQSWRLSADTCLAIRHHHDFHLMQANSSLFSRHTGDLIALAQLAEHLLQCISGKSLTCEWSKMGEAILSRLKLNGQDIQELVTAAQDLPLSEN